MLVLKSLFKFFKVCCSIAINWSQCYTKNHNNLPWHLHFIVLKHHGNLPLYHSKLPKYLSLTPWTSVTKLFTVAIYCHPMVITVVILFYNTEWQQCRGMAVNYHRKKLIFCWKFVKFSRAESEFAIFCY